MASEERSHNGCQLQLRSDDCHKSWKHQLRSDDCRNGCQPRVVIIGAGISGIAAGSLLAAHGFTDFVILEASERVGGRIWSIDLETCSDKKAELGANWIHGVDQNPIYKIARQHKLLDEPVKGKQFTRKVKFVREDGSPVNTKVVEEVDWTFGLLMSQVEEFYQHQMETPVENDSVGAFLMRGFDWKMRQKGHQGQDRKLRKMIFCQRMCHESMITGCDCLDDVSLSEAGSFEELPGVHYVIRQGFESVVHILKENINRDRIKLNHVVTQVEYDQEGNGATEHEVCVQCQNGQKFYANHVLVTCSLGYLKKCSGRLFSPPLPNYKLNAMNRLSFGTVNKIILEFEARILPENILRLEVIWDNIDNYSNDLSENWIRKIGSFDAISDTVLVGWLSGREAEYVETLTEEELGHKCCETLKRLLQTRDIPNLKRVVRSTWQSNPYTCGSYVYIPCGGSVEDVEALSEPIVNKQDKPLLLFGGEATHPTFYSSSHGALLSGQREAQRIIDLYGH